MPSFKALFKNTRSAEPIERASGVGQFSPRTIWSGREDLRLR